MMRINWRWLLPLVLLLALGLAGCEDDSSTSQSSSSDTYDGDGVTISIDYPDTLTGGSTTGTTALSRTVQRLGGGRAIDDCFYEGNDEWWVNGYNMTQFLIGTSATWTCITENLIAAILLLPLPNGTFIDISDDSDPDGATGLMYSKVDGIYSFEFFYGGSTQDSDLWVAWTESGGAVEGKLILTDTAFDEDDGSSNELAGLRVDFLKNSDEESADLYVEFGETTDLIGYRAEVMHDLSGTFPDYTAKGIVELRSQWSPDFATAGVTAIPDLRIITYADDVGSGAAIGRFVDAGLSLQDSTSDFGLYLFNKDDIYYFDADGTDEFINKTIDVATYEGGRDATPGELDLVEGFLGLGGSYFDANCNDETATAGSATRDCDVFVQALYVLPWSGEETNSGVKPVDERSTLIDAVTEDDYLDTSLPEDVFDHTFTPSI